MILLLYSKSLKKSKVKNAALFTRNSFIFCMLFYFNSHHSCRCPVQQLILTDVQTEPAKRVNVIKTQLFFIARGGVKYFGSVSKNIIHAQMVQYVYNIFVLQYFYMLCNNTDAYVTDTINRSILCGQRFLCVTSYRMKYSQQRQKS